jgi:galactokinase
MLPRFINQKTPGNELSLLYGDDVSECARQQARYRLVVEEFGRSFGSEPTHIYSSPGRCELGGNHTDHNGGLVLAATINLDVLAAVSRSDENTFTIYSSHYEHPFRIDLNALFPNPLEDQTSQLLRGVACGFDVRGLRVGGLRAFIHSEVLFASGLSSSAALEMLIATILNDFYNNSSLSVRELATIGQEAEHLFWGKPVGLLDQLAIGTGGVVHMSFRDASRPVIETLKADLSALGYALLLVNPGGDHAHLTEDYRQVPTEMRSVAEFFGKRRLIEVDEAEVLKRLPELRPEVGDRAILRSLHFFGENERVRAQVNALRRRHMSDFLLLVTESGSSSWRYLQNVFSPAHALLQPLALALALAELQTRQLKLKAAYRVHGGGFGGTIILIVPHAFSRLYQSRMDAAFGEGACHRLRIRPIGCIDVNTLGATTEGARV